jgi:hypothetical protein
VDVDITFGWLPFEREALDRAERLDLGGVVMPVARPEDLVIYKAVAWRDRDRADIERLLALHVGRSTSTGFDASYGILRKRSTPRSRR